MAKKRQLPKPVEEEAQALAIPLEWGSGEDIPTLYANQLIITHSGGKEFYLVFGEAVLPLQTLLNLGKENLPKSVPVKPLAKIAVSPQTMIEFANLININVNNFLRKSENSTDEDEK